MNAPEIDITVIARDLRQAARRINELVFRDGFDGVQFLDLYDAAHQAIGAAAALDRARRGDGSAPARRPRSGTTVRS
jgi:hypothetical protein